MHKEKLKLNKRRRQIKRRRRKFIMRMIIIGTVIGLVVYIPAKIKEKKLLLVEKSEIEKKNEENRVLETFNNLKEYRKNIYGTDDMIKKIDSKIEKITLELEDGISDEDKRLVDELNDLLEKVSAKNNDELKDLFNKLSNDEMSGFTSEEINEVNKLIDEYNSFIKNKKYIEAKMVVENLDNYMAEVKKGVEKRTTDEIYKIKSNEDASSRKPTYINGILLVNKRNGLPDSFGNGMDSEAMAAFEEMKSDAAKDGISINIVSGFRSYWQQVGLYDQYVYTYGQEPTDTFSAKPGFSEHQTGLTMDIGGVDESLWAQDDFKYTDEAEWLKNNCYKYGFILRYPEGKEWKTGFMHESWHFRYIGKEHSKNFKDSNLTLEEYLGQ